MRVWGLVAAGVVLLGVVASLLLRRREPTGERRATLPRLLLVSTVLYGLGLVAFTLFPLPASSTDSCAEGGRDSRLTSLITFDEARNMARDMGPSFLMSPSFLQILLNVALFVPLGLLIGWRTRWPLVTAAIAGLAGSLLIELTQATGIWWLYDCAYRFADLQDIVTNTVGAVIGGLIGRRLVSRRRWPDPDPDAHPGG